MARGRSAGRGAENSVLSSLGAKMRVSEQCPVEAAMPRSALPPPLLLSIALVSEPVKKETQKEGQGRGWWWWYCCCWKALCCHCFNFVSQLLEFHQAAALT